MPRVDPLPLFPVLAPDALRSAVSFLRRGVRPDGSHEEGSDWEIASHQWGLFISWAYNRGVALPATLSPEREGGREHDLLFDAANNRWLKFTKPFSAGWTMECVGNRFVRRLATPLQYLRRWRLVNRLFRDDVQLVGLSCLGRTQRIVISQPRREGEPATWDEIDHALTGQADWQRLPKEVAPTDDLERRAYRRGRLVVFDVCPENCLRTADGSVRFVDVIPLVCGRMEAVRQAC